MKGQELLIPLSLNCRTASIKTRIETGYDSLEIYSAEIIAERLPLKQGLKLCGLQAFYMPYSFIAERLPLKQGLKQAILKSVELQLKIAERLPLKQGLKLINNLLLFDFIVLQNGFH